MTQLVGTECAIAGDASDGVAQERREPAPAPAANQQLTTEAGAYRPAPPDSV